MKYEPGAMALCIDPSLPKQMVTLLQFGGKWFDKPAWKVRFPSAFCWPGWHGPPSADGWVPQKFLILQPGDVEPETVTGDMDVPA